MPNKPTRGRHSPQAQVALIAAGVVALVGAGLLFVLVVGVLEGVRGTGPLLLAGLTLGVFALAARLVVVARSMGADGRARVPKQGAKPAGAGARPRPQPRPRT